MAVRPVEFTGMIQNTHGASANRATEQNRPQVQQEQTAISNQQQAAVSTTQVSESEASAQDSFDPQDGGDGTGYQGNKNKKNKEKEKKKMVSDGVVRVKSKHSSFNISV